MNVLIITIMIVVFAIGYALITNKKSNPIPIPISEPVSPPSDVYYGYTSLLYIFDGVVYNPTQTTLISNINVKLQVGKFYKLIDEMKVYKIISEFSVADYADPTRIIQTNLTLGSEVQI